MNLRPIFLAYQTDTNMTSNPRDYITHAFTPTPNRTGSIRVRRRERESATGARPQTDDEDEEDEDDDEGDDDDSSRGVSESLHLLLQPESRARNLPRDAQKRATVTDAREELHPAAARPSHTHTLPARALSQHSHRASVISSDRKRRQ